MSDENTTHPPSGSASGLQPPEAVAIPPVTVDAPTHKECRSEPRAHVRWHVDALIDGQGVFHGFIKNISLQGADIFLDHNMQSVQFVKLHIHVPPLHLTDDHRAVEVSGKVIYSNHDSDELLFRTGIKFLHFKLESDQAYLQSCMAGH